MTTLNKQHDSRELWSFKISFIKKMWNIHKMKECKGKVINK